MKKNETEKEEQKKDSEPKSEDKTLNLDEIVAEECRLFLQENRATVLARAKKKIEEALA